jgi:hypothetical protein
VHEPAPADEEYHPAAQSTQADDVFAPTKEEYLAIGHLAHEVDPVLDWYSPPPHEVHTSAPDVGANRPAMQLMQYCDDDDPITGRYLPARHAMHATEALDGWYVPEKDSSQESYGWPYGGYVLKNKF